MLLATLYIVNYADKAVLGIIAQPLAEELGMNSSQIGLVGSLFFLAFTIGGFFAGALNRWMALRWSLLVIAMIWSAVMLPLLVVTTFAVLLVSRLILGFAEGPSSALLHSGAYSWHPPSKRGLPGAIIAGGGAVAQIAVAPLLALVTATMGWRAALVSLAILGFLWCAVWLVLWSEGPYLQSTDERAESVDDENGVQPADEAEPAVPWSRIFLTRTFITGALLVMSVYALVTVVLTWLPSYFEVGLGYSRLQAGSMFALPSILGLTIMLSSSALADRFLSRGARVRVVRIVAPATGVLICGALLLVLPIFKSPIVAVLLVSVGYGLAITVFPMFNAAISEICPPRQIPGTLGTFLAIMAVGGLIAPYATGLVVDAASSPGAGYAAAFQGIGLIAAICSLLALLLANPERDRKLIRGR
nr:MFS transporter [Rhodococcus wratislaviensis]